MEVGGNKSKEDQNLHHRARGSADAPDICGRRRSGIASGMDGDTWTRVEAFIEAARANVNVNTSRGVEATLPVRVVLLPRNSWVFIARIRCPM